MAKGFGIRAMAEGFLGGAAAHGNGNGHASNGSDQIDALLGKMSKLVTPAIEKLTGQNGAPEQAASDTPNNGAGDGAVTPSSVPPAVKDTAPSRKHPA